MAKKKPKTAHEERIVAHLFGIEAKPRTAGVESITRVGGLRADGRTGHGDDGRPLPAS